ncbi:MAG: DNA polymerase III subunit gamma/tau [Deltaproteobacteria bacterium]|nr:DNA polymerase III subunit gamma/tau [Deltaproteobacteria bacterium]
MSYLVLARKWRPQRFEDIVGQSHITRVLRNAISAGRIAHAYLFTGVRGVGKTTAARILAKALNCETGPTADPCDQCGQCVEIMGGSSIDVYEIDGASNRGIDEVRQIIENVRYQPAKSRFKIYIIDEVHQVTKDAFNALLKTLEEPPPFVKFILATTEPHRLPETILSRCQRFDFRRIPAREIIQRLSEIAEKEGLRITEGALLLLAREAEGSMRDGQSLLEQILSYAAPSAEGEKTKVLIDEILLQDILGIAERKTLYDLSAAVIRGDARRCVEIVGDVMTQGRDLPRLSRDLVEHFRNLLVVRLAQDGKREPGGSKPQSSLFGLLLDLPDQEIEDLRRQVAELSVDTLMDFFCFMAEGDEGVSHSPYPRFALETALVRLATVPKAVPISHILDRLEKMERKLSRGASSTPPPQRREDDVAIEGPEREASLPDSIGEENDREEVWKKFVAFVMREKKVLGSHLAQVRPLEMPPGPLKIGVGERYHLSYLQDAENLSSLREFARRFFSREVVVGVTPVGSRKPEVQEEANEIGNASRPINDAGKDIVKETLRIFGGSVKGIKNESR